MPSSAAPRPCCRPRPLVFTLTFFSYGVFHVGRKSFSTIKPILEQESFFVDGGSLSQNEMLGLLDTLFLGFYSAGLYMSGSLADRVNPRHVIAFGLLGSAFLSVLFGLGGVMNCRALPLYATIWGLNGLVQSTGWPANVSVMGAWFPSSRGTLFGLWSANISGGNILGTAVILLLLQVCGDSAGWRVSMFVIGAIMAVQAALVLMLLQPRPEPSSPARAPDAEAGSATLLDPAARLAAAGRAGDLRRPLLGPPLCVHQRDRHRRAAPRGGRAGHLLRGRAQDPRGHAIRAVLRLPQGSERMRSSSGSPSSWTSPWE